MSLDDLKRNIENAKALLNRIETIENKRNSIEGRSTGLKFKFIKEKINEDEYKKKSQEILKGKLEDESLLKYDKEITDMLRKVMEYNHKIMSLFEVRLEVKNEEGELINPKEARKFLKNLKKGKIEKIDEKYVLYEKNFYGQFANQLFSETTVKFTKRYPDLFRDFYEGLRISNIKIFSETYINTAFLSGLLSFIFSYAFLLIFFGIKSYFSIVQYLFLSILISVGVVVGFYYWPRIVIDGRRREIRNELPFAIMHMSSIAGSGAPLTSVFDTLLKSGEYKSLNGEIKRIMNYVNLFGYNLSTALRNVAETTPSKDFKELLNGMISTIETGGDLKLYLQNKATDTFNSYKNERKKYVETLATYSDVYTAVLIAAPLLFIIVLVLVSLVGNKLGGLDIDFIQKLGIYFVVPAFNVLFIVFINIIQPEL